MSTNDPLNTKQEPAGELPVFVDDSGRRQRNMKRIGYLMAVLGAGFLGMVGVGLAAENVGPSLTQAGIFGPFELPPAAVGNVAVKVPTVAQPPRRAPAPRVQPPPPATTEVQPLMTAPTTPTATEEAPAPAPEPNPNPNPNPNPGEGEAEGAGTPPANGAGQPVAPSN